MNIRKEIYMDMIEMKYQTRSNQLIHYYEIKNEYPVLVLIHGQGTSTMSYRNVIPQLEGSFHVILVDCYGHGKSSHNKETYNIVKLAEDIMELLENKIGESFTLLGHSSGGLIAAYIASKCKNCIKLILEDPPFFASCGERRFNTYNYRDLSTVCHQFLNQNEVKDFQYYYFKNQYCWKFFPDKSREKLKNKLSSIALKRRTKHPERPLKVPFWPKNFLEVFAFLDDYDPYFGEAFYNHSFNQNVDYEKILSEIRCPVLFMKAKAPIGEDGVVQGALTEEDLKRVTELISDCCVVRFECGHGIHNEKPKEFVKNVMGSLEKQPEKM